jgi:DNA polymerase I-like protein with 3'-5' exonuclease and polymerase domains/5'-3' exonuclease
MRIAFDGASFLWTALRGGKDKEHGQEVTHGDKKVWVNSAQFGYDHAMNMMLRVMESEGLTPHRCILVFEGLHSKKRRQAIEPTYKANRDGDKPPEAYIEYDKAIKLVEQAWLDVGACSMRQPFVEGDDTLGYLAKHSEDDLLVATYDNDLLALAGVNEQGKQVRVWVDDKIDTNKYGDFPLPLVTLYKSLVGDANDNIKGCVGFGVKTWETFAVTYGDEGLWALLKMLEAGTLGDLHLQREEDKAIRLICEQEAQVMRSYQLAKIHPEWVNTRNKALEIRAGMVKLETIETDGRLSKWAGKSWLVDANNFANRAEHCRSWFKHSPFVALDIETSTPAESDEWLANQVPPNPDGVDVLGSELTGLSLTYGDNLQYTVYISVNHAETANVSSEEVRKLVADIPGDTVIQNMGFELTVLYQEWSAAQEDNGYHGFLPRVLDTKLEASYVNENIKNGLKGRSLHHLGYKQQEYKDVCRFTGPVDELRPGGRLIKTVSPRVYYNANDAEISEEQATALDAAGEFATYVEEVQTREYKMRELPATHVFGYGCDDTICTASLHNHYRLVMELEHAWQTYLDVEIDAAYMSAVSFLQGTDFSAAKMRELEELDNVTYSEAWATLRNYLMSKGWAGSICPEFGVDSKPADFKLAYQIVTGKELDTKARNADKLAALMAAEGEDTLSALLLGCYKQPPDGPGWVAFNTFVQRHFKGEPVFNGASPIQKQRLLYEVMGLPIRIRNKPTDEMKAAGIREGSPKTDVLAIEWAKKFDAKPEDKPVLEAIKLMQMVETRRSLYYNKYPGFLHWKTGKLHSSLNQCEANTRRSSESTPNKQQLPKNLKIEGQPPRFREVIVPHHANAVIVSLDEDGQELRVIADYSKDPGMVACYVGDNKKKMHSMTGVGIAAWKFKQAEWSYEVFEAARKDHEHPLHSAAKECYALGKKVNFTTEYGAMAKKVAETLIIDEAEAQVFVDAKEKAFPVAAAWKDEVIREARNFGFVRTKMGAVRHLRDALNSMDGYEASKAERQAVNFLVQSGAAEQTKRAYGSAWKRGLAFKYDCVFIGPIHDEVVWSVAIKDLLPFLVEMHACMVQPYGGMTIPIVSSISFGPNFGEQVEVDGPTAEAVARGLEELEVLKRKAAHA